MNSPLQRIKGGERLRKIDCRLEFRELDICTIDVDMHGLCGNFYTYIRLILISLQFGA